jgi:hypothetical protein
MGDLSIAVVRIESSLFNSLSCALIVYCLCCVPVYLQVVISALMKLAGGSPSFASELNVDAFLEQVSEVEEE